VRASHPEPTVAVTAIATALAVSTGLGLRSLWVAAAFLSGQLSVGWSNDWIDAARDARNQRADKPVGQGRLPVTTVRTAALAALGACVPLSLAMGLAPGLLHLAAVAAAWSYNARLKATVLSFLPYALAFGAVPSIVVLALPAAPWRRRGRPPPVRCSASGPTCATRSRTWRRTSRRGCAGCPTCSDRPARPRAQRCCS
jgi:4-hydroxybenzoate polyprenyltransferase